jgi:ABC-type nitrate/sulfonate/bicarbonate transport system substrate-binding protein
MKTFLKTVVLCTTVILTAVASLPTAASELKIAIVSRTVFFVPLWIAHQKGFLKDEGIDATIEVFDNAEKINEAVRAGRVNIAVGTPESVIIDAYRGGSLRIISGNTERLPHFIITKPAINTLQQLRGAKIGVLSLNEGTTYLVDELGKSVGLKRGDYEVVAVGGAPTRWKLLQEGKIDAGLQPFPLSYQAEAAGFVNHGPISAYVPDYLFTTVNADVNWTRNNREMTVAFLRALRRGLAHMQANPGEAADIAAKELNAPRALAERALADTARLRILSADMSVSEKALARTFETVLAVGLLPTGTKFEPARVVDDSYLKQSLKKR